MPSSVVKVKIEKSSDVKAEPKLAGPYTPANMVITELFKKGTEPTEISTRYYKLAAPKNLGISYEPSKNRINMSWDRVTSTLEVDTSYGELGYRVYKDGKEIAFTNKNVYSIENVGDPNARYDVRASYRNDKTNISESNKNSNNNTSKKEKNSSSKKKFKKLNEDVIVK